MRCASSPRSDWIIDVGPGAGSEGGRIVASGTPAEVARVQASRTAPYLAKQLEQQPVRQPADQPAQGTRSGAAA